MKLLKKFLRESALIPVLVVLVILALCARAYSAEFLIYDKDHWMDALTQGQIDEYVNKYPNFQAKYDARYQRGDVVEVRPDGYWNGSKAHGYRKDVFLLVTVPNLPFKDASKYGMPILDENDRVLKKRKYNFSNVTDRQIINDLSEITVIETRIVSAKKTIYISPVMFVVKCLFNWLFG